MSRGSCVGEIVWVRKIVVPVFTTSFWAFAKVVTTNHGPARSTHWRRGGDRPSANGHTCLGVFVTVGRGQPTPLSPRPVMGLRWARSIRARNSAPDRVKGLPEAKSSSPTGSNVSEFGPWGARAPKSGAERVSCNQSPRGIFDDALRPVLRSI